MRRGPLVGYFAYGDGVAYAGRPWEKPLDDFGDGWLGNGLGDGGEFEALGLEPLRSEYEDRA